MSKLMTTLIALCLAMVAGGAIAQDAMKKDKMEKMDKKSEMKKDMSKDMAKDMAKDKKGAMMKDDMKKGEMKK